MNLLYADRVADKPASPKETPSGGRLPPEMTSSLFPNENLFLGTVFLKAGSRKRTDRRLRKRMRVGSPKSSGALWPKVFSRKREVRGS